ncbi:MAG: hypothetical protein J6K81_02620 [Rikenellaceae bacterium]|nr:hypothetical protein [Rikenellaceae bacterium]
MNEKLIITPSEVVLLAFATTDHVRDAQITEAEILAAQQKFMIPVFGELWEVLCAGEHSDFTQEYIKPALAQFVKARVLPSLGAVTASGVVQRISDTTKRAADSDLQRMVRVAYDIARTLRGRAVAQLEAHPELYPEYDKQKNILHRARIDGGVVL